MVSYCAVTQCISRSKSNRRKQQKTNDASHITTKKRLHKFPSRKNIDLQQQWVHSIKRPDLKNASSEKLENYYVCSNHFFDRHYNNPNDPENSRLLPTAIPSRNIPLSYTCNILDSDIRSVKKENEILDGDICHIKEESVMIDDVIRPIKEENEVGATANESTVQAPECLKISKNRKIYSKTSSYLCSQCTTVFNLLSNSKRDKLIYYADRPYPCSICDESLKSASDSTVHERSYPCSICDAIFMCSKSLKVHERIHTEKRLYHCSMCDVSFTSASNLKTHERIHTGERPFQCSICNVSFKQSSHLKAHERVHTDERPFQCSLCDLSFKDLGNFNSHKRSHTDERPYQCSFCDATFKYSRSMKHHQSKHKQ